MVLGWLGKKRERPNSKLPPDRVYRAGDLIGGHWLVRRVMEGGLGVVYAVQHREQAWGGRCVLKAPKGQSDAVRESFRAEAETWVRLGDHSNIVRALGIDEFAGQLFVVAELIEADDLNRVTLRDYLRSGPLRANVIAAWTADFCYGLDYARSKGLVAHRDIKPENLLIGRSGVLRITDFGIARAMTSGSSGAQAAESKLGLWQTNGGQVAGTQPYMAPEQWGAEMQDLRTDIYAFGVTLYEMCYGHWPFMGPDFRQQHLRIEPQIPQSNFAAIIGRCLSKDPATRYPAPMALFDDVSRVSKENGFALPPKPKDVGQKVRELDALAQGLGALGKFQEGLAAARKVVELEPGDPGNWTQLGRLLLETGDSDGALIALERSLDLDRTRSPAWNNLGIALKRQKKWQQAISAFDRALDCDPFNTGAMLNCSEALQHVGRKEEAVVRLKRAVQIAPDKFSIWNNLGAVYIDIGDKKNALDCLRRARALAPDRHHREIDRNIQFAQTLTD